MKQISSEQNLKKFLITAPRLREPASNRSQQGKSIRLPEPPKTLTIDKKSISFKTTLAKLQMDSSSIYDNLTTLSRTRRAPTLIQKSTSKSRERQVPPMRLRQTELLDVANNSLQPSLMLDTSKPTNDRKNLSMNGTTRRHMITSSIQFQTNRLKPRLIKGLSPILSPTNLNNDFKIIINDGNNTTQNESHVIKAIRNQNASLLNQKRFVTAKRVIKCFEGIIQTKSRKASEDDKSTTNSDDPSSVDILYSIKINIETMLESIDSAISTRKEKPVFEEYLERMTDFAQRTKNLELHIAALRTTGKIRIVYSDIYRAIQIFKLIKYLADQNRSFTHKLKAYKYLAVCYHRVKNYRMATFYNVKMLQTAWLCQSKRYELLAYDKIGVEYYYQGDVKKASFYHERMMSGKVEPKDSKLRELGITRLLNRMAEGPNATRKKKPRKMEEELNDYEIPASEDEFELPSPRNQRHGDGEAAGSLERKDTFSPKRRTKDMRNKTAQMLQNMFNDTSRSVKEKRQAKSRENLASGIVDESLSVYRNRNKKDLFEGPINTHVLLSHMSPNRLLNNFHPKDTKYIVSTYIARGTESDENFAILDLRSLEEIRRKLEKLKENTKLVLNSILEKSMPPKFNGKTFFGEQNVRKKIYVSDPTRNSQRFEHL